MGGRRCTNAELRNRVSFIMDLIIKGYRTNEIYRYVSETRDKEGNFIVDWHNITTRQIDEYIQDANEYFRKNADIDRRKEIGKATIRYQSIYKNALTDKEYYSAIRALERIDKILGTEAPIKIDNMIDIDELFEGLPEDFKNDLLKEIKQENNTE